MGNNNDDKLQDLVRTSLEKDKDLSPYALNADVMDGRVRVEGIVDTLTEKKRVEKLLKTIPGVKKVDAAVAISTDGAISDEDVTMEVQEELNANRQIDTEHIGAYSVGGHGTVILKGQSDDPEEIEAAIRSASKARGVTRVLNQIKHGKEEPDLKDIFHSQVNNDEE